MGKLTKEQVLDKFKENGKPHRFTSENQPSPEAKSKASKKSWAWKRLRQSIFEEIMLVQLPDGSVTNFWEEASKIIHSKLLTSKSKLSDDNKLKLLMKLMEMTPKTDNLSIETSDKDLSKITLEFVEAKKKEKEEKTDEKDVEPETSIKIE